jgi:hypothetical protein
MPDEKAAMEAYLSAGVDLPELKEEPKAPEVPEVPPTTEPPVDEPKDEEHLQDNEPKEQKKRSIYDKLKSTKSDLRSERELREQAERERDDFKRLLEERANAATPQERQEAQDELDAYAQEIGADAQALKRMKALFLKDVPQASLSDEDRAAIEEIRQFKAQNQKVMEKQLFEEEFRSTVPTLKDMFPSASDEELDAMKGKLDELAHTKDFHDKSLDYVAFKHRTQLEQLVSPKKRGLEPRSRQEATEESFDFDPNADLSKMTPKQLEKWEANYRKLTSSSELLTDAEGRKIIV